jgi:plasmid segregation protein ParM
VQIAGLDAGKFQIKGIYSGGIGYKNILTKSNLCHYRDLKGDIQLSEQELVIEHEGKKYFGGDLAEREGFIPISFKDESKAYMTTLINVLTALHQIDDTHFKIVVGSPIKRRTETEKKVIKDMIKGKHTIVVNGFKKDIHIEDVEVSPEGAAGFLSQPESGEIQGLDFGSTTINYFYYSNKTFVDRKSDTVSFLVGSMPEEEIMESLYSLLSNNFRPNNPTMLMGGKAKDMYPFARKFYKNSFIVQNPIFATAIGFYKIARSLYA